MKELILQFFFMRKLIRVEDSLKFWSILKLLLLFLIIKKIPQQTEKTWKFSENRVFIEIILPIQSNVLFSNITQRNKILET